MQTPTPLTKTLTLTALTALLLTGCGQKEVGSIPDAPTSTTANASTAEDSTPDQSQGAEAEVSTEDTQHYSGGSKAPEGEYRPADEQGPAQNVPVPKRPDGMNVESAEGLEKFLGYWMDSVNYGIQTGNFTYAEPLISDKYESDAEVYIWADEIYNRGGWLAGGLREVQLGENLLVSHGDGVYSWAGLLPTANVYSYLDTESDYLDNSWTQDQPVVYQISYSKGRWKLDGVTVLEGE